MDFRFASALVIFAVTVFLVIVRPKGIHETIPALSGAALLFSLGIVKTHDVSYVFTIVRNAALTIVSTFIMSMILEKAGLFRWAAHNIAIKTRGSGRKLFMYSILVAMMLTFFLNNDGSMLIGTPILIELCKQLKLKARSSFAILMAAAMVGTISSAPIGVSNLANLEAMTILNINLISHTEYMLLASIFGILTCVLMLYLVFRKDIPEIINVSSNISDNETAFKHPPEGPNRGPISRIHRHPHPHPHPPFPLLSPRFPDEMPKQWRKHPSIPSPPVHFVTEPGECDWWMIRIGVVLVIATRIAFFIGAYYNVPVYIVAVTGASILVIINSMRKGLGVLRTIGDAPWHVLLFAFGMELTVWGLRNIGITESLGHILGQKILQPGGFLLPGIMVALFANGMNNHPALIISTLTLSNIDLPYRLLRLSYTASVLGSDIGSLITPIGTLASMMWFHLAAKKGFKFRWADYIKVSIIVIPVSFGSALLGLYLFSLIN